MIEAIDDLLNNYPSYKIADILNKRGMKSGTGQKFSLTHIERIRNTYNLSTHLTRLQKQGKITAKELASRLGVSSVKIRRCRELGLLKAHEYREGRYLYDDPGTDVATRIPMLKPNVHFATAYTTNEVQYAT